MLRFALCLATVVVAANARAEDKIDADKLIGVWKLTKSEELPAGANAVITYAKSGVVKAAIEFEGKKIEIDAKWKVEGNKLVITSKKGEKEEVDTDTIEKLTDELLVTKNKAGKTTEFKRVKEDKK